MIHISQTIVTKGMQGYLPTTPITTCGYLDDYIKALRIINGGEPISDLDLLFEIRGRKSFILDLVYYLDGSKIKELTRELIVAGKKQFPLEEIFVLRSKLIKAILSEFDVVGVTSHELLGVLELLGTKELHSLVDITIEGDKRFDFIYDRKVRGKRVNELSFGADLLGTKLTKLDNKLRINGRKDITNILIALDLLGGKDEGKDN